MRVESNRPKFDDIFVYSRVKMEIYDALRDSKGLRLRRKSCGL
jgi:hypothetical protein